MPKIQQEKNIDPRKRHEKLANEALKRIPTSTRKKQTINTFLRHLKASI